ncbi:MAG: Glu-tRNA(Gln) amidotransferase subunit GatE [Candidatus Aenigmatarchaeota archaeon]
MSSYFGLKVGLELHFQLDTERKLFCNCLTTMKGKNPIKIVVRKLHPVQSELGEIDRAAQFEYLRNRTFYYEVFKNECCLVELDEEPPHEPNEEALKIALQIAKLFNCKIPDEIYVMRKIVIDGSNTSGFQRTMIVGFDGYFDFEGKKIPITQISLEEDSAAIDKEENGKVYYKLNRLGIPLVEIDTGILEGFMPKEIEEIAYQIFLLASSTRKIRKNIGAIRQDVNVSIEGGARVEIKGVQKLSLISKVIEKEIERQLLLIKEGKKVEKETRAAKEDGTSIYMRPLPGSERMYPETDIKPIKTEIYLKNLEIPEPLTKIIERYKKEYKLNDQLVKSLLKSKYFFLFDEIMKRFKIDGSVVANILSSVIKDLERKENIDFDLEEEKIFEFFKALEEQKIFKEAAYEILKEMYFNRNLTIDQIVEKLNLKPLSEGEILKIIEETKKEVKDSEKLYSIVLSKVRGRANIQEVIKILKFKNRQHEF